jgi:hypothetical protein
MNIVLSFIGILPSYIKESIYQIRLFYKDDIYLIINDLESPYISYLNNYNVKIIPYINVVNTRLIEIVNQNIHKFAILPKLIGREELFVRSFERFFLLKNLMNSHNLSNCLFLELDNLIYDNPYNWLSEFSKHELCYMYDNDDRCSSGIMYVNNHNSLDNFLNYILYFIGNSNDFMTEMTTLYRYYENNKEKVQILPTYWNKENIPFIAKQNYDLYNDSIFDALAIGCFLLGLDPYHTNGKIEVGQKAEWCAIDYTKEIFEWKLDTEGRRIPYIYDGVKWLRVNNLHIHSKDLKSGISKEMS